MKKFKKIYIEITNVCNLSCSFCSTDNKEKRFMTIDEFEHILKEIDDFTDYIYLHVKGEPLLHPKLKEILDLCSKYNKRVNITTNGTLLKRNINILKNAKSLRQLNLSLHSENNESHYLDDIFASIEQLSEDVIVIYRFWTLNNLNLDKKSTETVDKIINYYNLSPEVVDKIKKDENIKISNNIYISKDNLFVWPSLCNNYYEENGFCYGLKSHIGILVDGTVIPCCLDSSGIINLGNIYKNSLKDILSTKKATTIRNNFNNRKATEELCRHCSFKARFDK